MEYYLNIFVKYCKMFYRNITMLTFKNIFQKKAILSIFRNIVFRIVTFIFGIIDLKKTYE